MTDPQSPALSGILNKFRSPYRLADVPPDTPCLIGLSGGADSRLLLHLLATEAAQTGAHLHPVHIHHGIRGAEADRDEEFCRTIVGSYGLSLDVIRLDIPAMARACGQSTETVARQARYRCFADIMRRRGIPLLATAHHADDNAETVLFRMARGTGLRGLCGIAPCRPFEPVTGGWLVRPLLACTKQDILNACRAAHLDFVTDSTNATAVCARNLLRLNALPVLRQISAHPEEQILRTCEGLREDEEFLQSLARELFYTAATDGGWLANIFSEAPPPIAKRALRKAASTVGLFSLEAQHLEQLLALCRQTTAAHRMLSLPGGYAGVERNRLSFFKAPPAKTTSASLSADLCRGGDDAAPDIPFADGNLDDPRLPFVTTCRKILETDIIPSINRENIYNPFIHDTLTFATITPCTPPRPWHWRTRRTGDILRLHGIHHKVRKLQNEAGVPVSLRTRLPLLCDAEDTILWVPFVGARDGFACDPLHTRPCFFLTLSPRPAATDHGVL